MREGRSAPRQPRLPGVLGLVAMAWLLVFIAYATGHGSWFGHGRLGAPDSMSLAATAIGWEVMTVAMMIPSSLPIARYVAANTLRPRRTVAAFLVGYLASWTVFFELFAFADTVAHRFLGATPSSERHAYVVSGIALTMAAGWQVTAVKRKMLRACRTVDVLPAHGRRADAAVIRLGLDQGANCVGSCGPLMLAMLAATHGRLMMMVLIACLAWLEKATRAGRWVAMPSAAVLAGVATASVVAGASGLAA